MNTPIIDTKCSSCRHPYRGRGEWDLIIQRGKLVGIVCPRCSGGPEVKTPGPSPTPSAVDASAADVTWIEEWVREGTLSPLVHLAYTHAHGLILELDPTPISSRQQASELGHTLLLLAALLGPVGSSSPGDLMEGPGLNAS